MIGLAGGRDVDGCPWLDTGAVGFNFDGATANPGLCGIKDWCQLLVKKGGEGFEGDCATVYMLRLG